jgi:lysophospholipase L1-like esterase
VREAGRRALLVLASVTLALTLAEGAVRGLDLVPDVIRLRIGVAQSAYEAKPNPILGYGFKANYRDDGQPDLHESFPYINAHGQRDIERTLEKEPETRRIILLGDSVVAAHGIRDLDDGLSRQLELLFDGPPRTEVLNFGVGGYCTRAEAELLRLRGLQFAPDLVVVLFNETDYGAYSQAGRYPPYRPPAIESLFARSALFRLTALRTNLYRFREQFEHDFRGTEERRASALLGDDNVTEGLGLIAQLAASQGFDTLLVTWPLLLDNVSPGFEDSWANLAEETAASLGVPTARLTDHFRRDYDAYLSQARVEGATIQTVNERYGIKRGDLFHPNEFGARVGAAALYETIAPRLGPPP